MSKDERIAHSLQRVAAEEESARAERRSVWLLLVVCVLWAALGLFLVMWSAHTSNLEQGRLAFSLGLIIGNGGIVVTLIYGWYRSQR